MSMGLFMSLVKLLITMITLSAMGESSFKARKTRRRRKRSWDWKSLVMEKKTSVASLVVNLSPWYTR